MHGQHVPRIAKSCRVWKSHAMNYEQLCCNEGWSEPERHEQDSERKWVQLDIYMPLVSTMRNQKHNRNIGCKLASHRDSEPRRSEWKLANVQS